MFFLPMKLADWGMDNFKLFMQIFSVVLILIILVYVALSSKDNE